MSPGPSRVLAENDAGLGQSWPRSWVWSRRSSTADPCPARTRWRRRACIWGGRARARWSAARTTVAAAPRRRLSPVAKFLRARAPRFAIGDETSRLLARRVHPWLPSFSSEFIEGDAFAARARALARSVDTPRDDSREGSRRGVQTPSKRGARRAVRGGVHPRRGGGGVVHLRRGGVHPRRLRSHRHLRRLLLLRRRVPLPRGGDASAFRPAAARTGWPTRCSPGTGIRRVPGRRGGGVGAHKTTRCARCARSRGDASARGRVRSRARASPRTDATRRALPPTSSPRVEAARRAGGGVVGGEATGDANGGARARGTRARPPDPRDALRGRDGRGRRRKSLGRRLWSVIDARRRRETRRRRDLRRRASKRRARRVSRGVVATPPRANSRRRPRGRGRRRRRRLMPTTYAALRVEAAVDRAARLAEAHASSTRDAYGDVPANMAAATPGASAPTPATLSWTASFEAPRPPARSISPTVSSRRDRDRVQTRLPGALRGAGRGDGSTRGGGRSRAGSSRGVVLVGRSRCAFRAARHGGRGRVFVAGVNVVGIISADALLPTTRLATRARQEESRRRPRRALRGAPTPRARRARAGPGNSSHSSSTNAGSTEPRHRRGTRTRDAPTPRRTAKDDRSDRSDRSDRPDDTDEGGGEIRVRAPLAAASVETCGARAAACATLARGSPRDRGPDSARRTASSFLSGCWSCARGNEGVDRRLLAALTAAESAVLADDADALADACEDARRAAENRVPPRNSAAVSAAFDAITTGRVVVCASSDADDVARIGGVDVVARASSSREVAEATRDAWTVAFAPDAIRPASPPENPRRTRAWLCSRGRCSPRTCRSSRTPEDPPRTPAESRRRRTSWRWNWRSGTATRSPPRGPIARGSP